MSVPTWPRPLHQPGGMSADLVFQVFSQGPLPEELPFDPERHPAGDPPEGIFLSGISAEDAPGWFERHEVEADHCYEVAGEVPDPADLAYLQHAWAVVRCLCVAGGGPVFDSHARRWWSRDQVLGLAADRAFDIRAEIEVLGADSQGPLGMVLFTVGMAKFGQPDLVLVQCGDGDEAKLYGLAEALAQGLPVGDGLELAGADGISLLFVPYEPDDMMPDLGLMNEALVVVRQ